MNVFRCGSNSQQAVVSLASVLVLALAMPAMALAQNEPISGEKQQQAGQTSSANPSLADQIHELQAKVAKLEAALKQEHQAKPSDAPGGMSMKMGNMPMGSGAKAGATQGTGMMGRGMMGRKKDAMAKKDGMMGMGMMSKKDAMAKKEMSEKGKMKGMKMMGSIKGMRGMKATEPLPAFPGAPGIYHVGATGFYLDHADEISLTPAQQTTLNQIKEQTQSQQTTFDQQIAKAEEELGVLTGSDKPDTAKIEAHVRDIERLRGDQRIAFVRSVGRAAVVLTDLQRKTITGQQAAPNDEAAAPAKTEP